MKTNKAQVWGFDLTIAVMIFFVGILSFYIFMVNQQPADTNLRTLKAEGERVADLLLSEGYPSNWDISSVTSIGLLSEGKINSTKLEYMNALNNTDYYKVKRLLRINNNFYISFKENITLLSGDISGIGKQPINPKNLIRVSRFTVYKDKPMNLFVDIWE